MARLREHNDGRTRRWEVQWSVEQGRTATGERKRKHYSQSFRTKERAEAFKRQKEDQASTGSVLLDPSKGRRPLSEWAEQWFIDWEPTVKEQTAKKSRGLLDCSVLPALGYLPVRKIEPSDVQAWIRALSAPDPVTNRARKPSTVKHHYLVLKSVLDYAMNNGAIAASPAASVKLPTNKRMGTRPRKMRFLTEAEVDALADAFSESPYPLMIRFMAWTGLRVGEVAGLNIGDVNLQAGTVLVERTRRKVKGGWVVDTIKNGEYHDAPIGAVLDDLERYLENHPHRDDPAHPLFPGRTTVQRTKDGSRSVVDYGKPFDPGVFYQRHFKPALELAGLPSDVRQHDLRHTFASLCHRHGIPVQQVSYWMGHKDVTVTQVIYSHLYKDDTANHGDRLAKAARRARAKTDPATNVTRIG